MESRILDKQTYYRLAAVRRFGNTLRAWPTLAALVADGYDGPVTIRYARPGSPYCVYGVPLGDLGRQVAALEAAGAERHLLRFSEPAPDAQLLIQGDVMRREGGWLLFFSTEPVPMRQALAHSGRHCAGLAALGMLQANLTAASLGDMEELLADYPESVVEFSAYRCDLGWARGRNTVIWEVRNY